MIDPFLLTTAAATGAALWLHRSRQTWRDIADAGVNKLRQQARLLEDARDPPGLALSSAERASRAVRAGVRELRRVAALGAEHADQTLTEIIAEPTGIRVDGPVNMVALTNAIVAAWAGESLDSRAFADQPDTVSVPIVTLEGLAAQAQVERALTGANPTMIVVDEIAGTELERRRDSAGLNLMGQPDAAERQCFGMPLEIDPALPPGQIDFRQDGKTIGSIVNADFMDPETQERLREAYTSDRHIQGDKA